MSNYKKKEKLTTRAHKGARRKERNPDNAILFVRFVVIFFFLRG
jgi:hypothetical protein